MNEPRPIEALEALGNLRPPPRWPLTVLGVALVVLAIAGLGIGVRVFAAARAVSTNQQAIRVNCRLLSNAIVQSGARGPGGANSPTQQLNELYISVIGEQMSPAERREERRLQTVIASSGATVVPLPDCERVAADPSSVKIVPIRRRP